MGIKMIRQPSETPNVTNIDDIIPFRYAYGNQDGYVIGKGNEISHTIDGNTFRVNSGRVVLQGVETDIDANGVSFTIDNASETRYFSVYYEVNLATQTTAIKLSSYSTSGYPVINVGDDLTANSSGIARIELYRFTVASGVISNVQKVAKAIEYSGTALVGYDISKGTVEERLTNLGFKEGSTATGEISFSNTAQDYINISNSNISVTKQGNYNILNLTLTFQNTYLMQQFLLNRNQVVLGAILKDYFKPKQYVSSYISIPCSINFWNVNGQGYGSLSTNIACICRIETNGQITIINEMSNLNNINAFQGGINIYSNYIRTNLGYEANSI